MSVQQRVQQTTDGLDTLSNLIDILSDPKAFAKNEQAIREQLTLTQEESDKADAARALIANADKLQGDLAAKQFAVDAGQADLDSKKVAFEDYKNGENIRLEALSADLDARSKVLDDRESTVVKAEKSLNEAQARVESQIKIEQAAIDAQKLQNEKDAADNANLASSLDALRESLSKRLEAVKLREQAAELQG